MWELLQKAHAMLEVGQSSALQEVFSLLLSNLACADLVADFGNWEEGGGVIVLVARTGEPSLGRSLTSAGPPGLERGVASPRRIAVSGIGVRGEVISDISIYVART